MVRSILKSPEVTKCIFLANSDFSQTIAIISIIIISKRNLKRELESFIHAPVTFLDQIWAKVNSFGFRRHHMKNIVFLGDVFSLTSFSYRIYENKNVTIVFTSSSRIKNAIIDLERSNSKSDHRSDLTTGQVRSWLKYVNMHIFRIDLARQVVWHHLCVSVSIMSRFIGEKKDCDVM